MDWFQIEKLFFVNKMQKMEIKYFFKHFITFGLPAIIGWEIGKYLSYLLL